jgi:hypothetical protein
MPERTIFALAVGEPKERRGGPWASVHAILQGILGRIGALEQRPQPRDGVDGRSVASAIVDGAGHLIVTLSDGTVADCGRVVGVNGADGKDGVPGRDGVDGRDGQDGTDGAPGRDGVNGKDGRDGVDGAPGEPGRDGKDGADGVNGKDGRGIVSAEIDASGHLVLAYSDGTSSNAGRVVGVNGKDGRDGVNGTDGKDGADGAPGEPGPPGPVAEIDHAALVAAAAPVLERQTAHAVALAVAEIEARFSARFDNLMAMVAGLNRPEPAATQEQTAKAVAKPILPGPKPR